MCSVVFVVVVSSKLVSAAHHLSPDVSFSPMWRCLWPQRHLSVSRACISKAFRHQQTSEKMPNYFYTSFGNEMDGTKQGRKKSIERSEKEELFVLQSRYVSSVGNPDRQTGRQADFCKQSKRTQSRATVGCIVQVCRFLPCTWSMQGKKEPLHWKQTTAWTSFASLSQNKTAAVCGS